MHFGRPDNNRMAKKGDEQAINKRNVWKKTMSNDAPDLIRIFTKSSPPSQIAIFNAEFPPFENQSNHNYNTALITTILILSEEKDSHSKKQEQKNIHKQTSGTKLSTLSMWSTKAPANNKVTHWTLPERTAWINAVAPSWHKYTRHIQTMMVSNISSQIVTWNTGSISK